MSHPTRHPHHRRQGGSALFVTVMMLVLMGFIGLASLDTVTADRKVAGFQTRARVALDAADAGVATGLATLLTDVDNIHQLPGVAALEAYNPPFPAGATAVGEAGSWPYGQPSFGRDPAVADAIDYLGSGANCDFITALEDKVVWRKSLWQIRVQGTTPDNLARPIQATASVCRPYTGS